MGPTIANDDYFNLLGQAQNVVAEFRSGLLTHLQAVGVAADIDQNQHVAHGFAWCATLLQAFDETCRWLRQSRQAGVLGARGLLAGQLLAGELLAECRGGIAMHQLETIRLEDFGLPVELAAAFEEAPVQAVIRQAGSAGVRRRFVELLQQDSGLTVHGLEGEPDALAMGAEIEKFSATKIAPFAHDWHIGNSYVPETIISELAELGVFGMSVSAEYGGSEVGKIAMCAVTEELSRGYIGAGSLGTRAEIAAELIGRSGRPEQRARILPGIVSGDILTAAAFTEPAAGV